MTVFPKLYPLVASVLSPLEERSTWTLVRTGKYTMTPAHSPQDNGLLAQLSGADLELLLPDLVHIDLPLRRHLATPSEPIKHVYFMTGGIASLVISVRHRAPIEVGIAGREGLGNMSVVLGIDRSPNEIFMQVAGSAYRVPSEQLRTAMTRSASVQQVMFHYVHVFTMQCASTVLANGRGTVTERLVRWLLMVHHRLDGNVLPLTHEFLGIMLGARRSSVTGALNDLQTNKLIYLMRGKIIVRDRKALIAIANGYYGFAESELNRLRAKL